MKNETITTGGSLWAIRTVSTAFLFLLLVAAGHAQQSVTLGRMDLGYSVLFVEDTNGSWGVEVSKSGTPVAFRRNPVDIEVFSSMKSAKRVLSGYQTVQKRTSNVVAKATVRDTLGVEFNVEDSWKVIGNELSVTRNVVVKGNHPGAGFCSSLIMESSSGLKWENADFLIPGLLYGKPHTRATAIGGKSYLDAGFFSVREDYLSAPMVGFCFPGTFWMAVLNKKPDGATTQEETTAPASTPIVDETIRFGALDLQSLPQGGLEIGFRLPGTTREFGGGAGGFGGMGGRNEAPSATTIRRRYNPVKNGFVQTFSLGFLFGQDKTFLEMERNSWRWAWNKLNPIVKPVNVEETRRALLDHLASQVVIADDRAGIPFVIDAVSGRPGSYRVNLRQNPNAPTNQASVSDEIKDLAAWAKTVGIDMDPNAAELNLWPMIVMGFCGKHIEVGEQFLMEADRDKTERGKQLRELGMKVLGSLVKYVPMSPYPSGEAFNLRTGKPGSARTEGAFGLRPLSEDMRIMVDILKREKKQGREHPDWFNWSKAYADWLLTQQRADGSFPMNWVNGAVKDTSGSCTYAAIPFLVKMAEFSCDKKYLEPAKRAGDYVWNSTGKQCYYLGATGTSTVTDKESGMLSMEAFLSLYEHTKEQKWLDRAKSAGDFTESWIWIWNVPMPVGALYSNLGWKPGVPTIGVNGIGSNDVGGVDQYLDWAVPSYAKLYKYTGDKHYLDVAYVLLHGTKAMLALPGRTYDLKGPGWQQEHWRMGPTRGIGAHRTWLPWISINHLHGITGLEEFDKELFIKLSSASKN